jgi:uncharacterized protein (DUF362 family)
MERNKMTTVTFIETEDREKGVRATLQALGSNPVRGKNVLIKPNFNTADPTPGSTHNDTLTSLVDEVWAMGAKSISLGERSYARTSEVMIRKGIIPLLEQKEVRVIDFDTLTEREWVEFKPKASHWSNGYRLARPILEAECLISTCCLKTHQYGGIFTMSLKLNVGVVPTFRHGFSYMGELHQSPHQEEMIAEINEPFSPDLVVLDGIDVFVDGGPAMGKRVKGNVFLASTDRVATDAVGLALLKVLGSNRAIMDRKIFRQRQIARAVELGLGASSAAEIDLVPVEPDSEGTCGQVAAALHKG